MTDMEVSVLEKRLNGIKDRFNQKKGKYDALLENKAKKEKELEKLKKMHERLEKARLMFMKTAEYQRDQIKKEFEKIVTQALQFIRNEEIFFEIDLEEKRGRAEAKFFIKTIRDGVATRTPLEDTSLKDSRGDGVSSIVRIALSIALLELSGRSGPLVMDEPAKEVSVEYIENSADLLKKISETFSRQIILSTHIDSMSNVASKKFSVKLIGTESVVEEV